LAGSFVRIDRKGVGDGGDESNGSERAVLLGFWGGVYLKPDKTNKNRKKPVETEEIWLTKRLERLKVNCGTVLRTRMNTEDFALKTDAVFIENLRG
jgi:hypothetical protein